VKYNVLAKYNQIASKYGILPKSLILDAIDKSYTEHPYYGVRRMQKALESIGIKAGKRKLSRIYKFMGIRADLKLKIC
jgi:putative transposase